MHKQEAVMPGIRPACVSPKPVPFLPYYLHLPPGLGKPGRREGGRENVGEGERERGRGGREGEEHRDAGGKQRGQSTPVSTCSFFSPSPVSWGRIVSVPPREIWSSLHLNPLPAPRKAGHPSACCLGDAGDARAVVADRLGLLPSVSPRMQDLGQPLA